MSRFDNLFCLVALLVTLVPAWGLMLVWEYSAPEQELPDTWFHIYTREAATSKWVFVGFTKGQTNYTIGEPIGTHRFYTVSAYRTYTDGTTTEAFAEKPVATNSTLRPEESRYYRAKIGVVP